MLIVTHSYLLFPEIPIYKQIVFILNLGIKHFLNIEFNSLNSVKSLVILKTQGETSGAKTASEKLSRSKRIKIRADVCEPTLVISADDITEIR